MTAFLSSLLAAAGGRTSGSIFGMPEQASTIAPEVDLVYDVITWISIFFFVLIVIVMVVFCVKYRRSRHPVATSDVTHNTPLEVTWTIIPLILVIAMFYVGFSGYVYMTTPPENSYEITAVAQRWSWTFNYPNGASDTNVLHLPKDRPVLVHLRSEDVLHALFLPAFRVKQDIVPGKRTQLWFEATRAGTFDLLCAEYCGRQHSQMVGQAIVYEEDRFESVVAELAAWCEKVPAADLPKAGAIVFNQCASCHTLDGSPLVGPSFKETFDLLRAGGSRTLKDGTTVKVDEAYIRNSILHPQQQIAMNGATGQAYPASMPPGMGNQLGPCKVEAMIKFITHLDEVTEAGRLKPVRREDLVPKAQPAQGN